jgi:DNA-directed RNA polymerase specialized sigma24 family protein
MERLAWSQCEPFEATVNSVAKRYIGRSGAEFDDLIQSGWECVCAKLQESLTPSEEDIERWVRSYIRELDRLHKGDSSAPLVYGGTPVKPVEQLHIRQALRTLPPELLTVVLLYGFGVESYVELGNTLGCDWRTAKRRLEDARIALRRVV